MSRPPSWLIVIDPQGIARVVKRSETSEHAKCAFRTRDHAVAVARRLNDGQPLVFGDETVEAGP